MSSGCECAKQENLASLKKDEPAAVSFVCAKPLCDSCSGSKKSTHTVRTDLDMDCVRTAMNRNYSTHCIVATACSAMKMSPKDYVLTLKNLQKPDMFRTRFGMEDDVRTRAQGHLLAQLDCDIAAMCSAQMDQVRDRSAATEDMAARCADGHGTPIASNKVKELADMVIECVCSDGRLQLGLSFIYAFLT